MSKFNFRMHHASLIVKNLEQSLQFYCGILGMQQVARPKLPYSGAWFQFGEQQLHLLVLDNPDPTTGRPEHGGRDRHVALNTAAIDPVIAALGDADVDYSMSKSGRRALFCRDPDGNAIEIIER